MQKKFEIWIADLNPSFGAESGKNRPVVVVQSDLLNGKLNTTMICPITSKVVNGTSLLRVRLNPGESGLDLESDILVHQVRAIDNGRFGQKIGMLSTAKQQKLDASLSVVFDL